MQGDDEHFRAPLFWLLAPYLAGLLAACAAPALAPEILIAITALAAAGVAVWLSLRADFPGARAAWTVAIAVAGFAGGMAWMQADLFTPARWRGLPPREATVEVVLERIFAPVPGQDRRSCIARITSAPPLIADIEGQRIFLALAPPEGADLIKTMRIRAIGVLEPLLGLTPESGSFDAFLQSSGVRFRLARASLRDVTQPPTALAGLWHRAGERLEQILRQGLPDTHPAAHAYVAMFMGRKSELDAAQREAFLRSGTMHLFAISGLHIGVIGVCLHTLLSLARLRGWAALVPGLLLLTAFVEATGGSASARRALIMVAMIWLGRATRRPANPLAALAASALGVLIVDPLALLSASFQMSYAVVGAILLYGVPLQNWLHGLWKPLRGLTDDEIRWWHRGLESGGRRLISLVAVSVAATSVSLPLSVAVFGLASPGAVLGNVLVLPAAGLAVTAGFAAIVCGLTGLAPLAVVFNHAAALVLWIIGALAEFAALLPGMFFHGRFTSAWTAAAVILVLIGVCVTGYTVRWRRPRALLLVPPAIVIAALVFLVRSDPGAQKSEFMKSAYELAMERLKKDDPESSLKLTDEQKAQLAETDRVFQGKIAEREIFLNQRLAEAAAGNKREELEQIRKQIASERARLEEDREDAKNKIRRTGEG